MSAHPSPSTIRTATPADLPEIMRLEYAGFVAGTHEDESVFAARIRAFPDGFLVAYDDPKRLLGYICSELWRFEPQLTREQFELGHSIDEVHAPAHEELYISSMTVDPATRGSGLGLLLFRECIARCRAAYPHLRSALLLVSADWVHAKRIYDREGFVEVMRLPGFFRPSGGRRADGIVMRKLLAHG